MAASMEWPRCFSIGSKSDTVLPRSMLPAVWSAPPACSRASNRVVLPAPGWPARATLRICCVEWGMVPFPPCRDVAPVAGAGRSDRQRRGTCAHVRNPAGGPHGAVMAVRGRNAAVRAFARGAVMAGAHLSASPSAGRVATQHASAVRPAIRAGNARLRTLRAFPRRQRSNTMGISRKASAHWEGDFKTGKGSLTTPASGLLDGTRYGFNSRFGDEKGTNPEELIAAAHAGCFTMALSAKLTEAGHPPESLDGSAEVDLSMEGGPS